MLNPEILKCHDLITLDIHKYNKEKQRIISFSYVKTLTSLAFWEPGGTSIIRLGPSWFTSTLSFILIYMSNIDSNLIRTF